MVCLVVCSSGSVTVIRQRGRTLYTAGAVLRFFLKDTIHIFEFVNGLFTGITIVGMRYDSADHLMEYQEFVPQNRVDLSLYAPGRRRQCYYLFHNQASAFFASAGDSWHSVGVPVTIPETYADQWIRWNYQYCCRYRILSFILTLIS